MFDWLPTDNLILNLVILLVGFVALIKGADIFVDGSADVARKFKVPGVIIGLTIVAMGTSAPELAVSVSAGLSGSNQIAVSNVVGSNIFNLIVVLGVCALLKPLPVDTRIKKRDFPISLIATVALAFMAALYIIFGPRPDMSDTMATAGIISRIGGIILMIGFVAYMLYTIKYAKNNKTEEDDSANTSSLLKDIVFIVLGAAMIVAGGDGVVSSAKNLAMMWGMSETLVGLTIVAIGTSLPELVTSIVASVKGENGMAIGNVVGSNIFNLLLILGVSSTIRPIPVTVASFFDLSMLLGVSIVAFIFVCTGKKITRIEGGIMVLMYIAYTTYAILR
ncbi:MAG: calcium/sodium antiporter [Eubacterium sp.]|nr:calcium/sodium antiporter [Eubacterium sp.]